MASAAKNEPSNGCSIEDETQDEVDRSSDDAFGEGDLRRGVAVKAGGDGVVDRPTDACCRDEHCADRDTCVRGAGKDHAADHDDDDAQS